MPPAPTPSLASLRSLWQPPEAHFARTAGRAERTLSLLRLGLLAVFVLVALADATRAESAAAGASVPVLVAGLAIAGGLDLMVRRRWMAGQLAFLAIAFEVGIVSALLAAHVQAVGPEAGTNDRVLFPIYLLIILATCVRFDPRTSLFAGALSMLAYLGLVGFALSTSGGAAAAAHYGPFEMSTQVTRMVLLLGATALATGCTLRVRDLVTASIRDELTGLLNRRVFHESVEKCIDQGRPFTVAMIDIDHFKRLNDTHGHAVGDVALRHLASLLQRSFRTIDVVSRYGGEEFAVVLIDGEANGCERRIEHVRETVSSARLRAVAPPKAPRMLDPVTISVGVAHWPDDGERPSDLMHAADARLYDAKRSGRNRVVGRRIGDGPVVAEVATSG